MTLSCTGCLLNSASTTSWQCWRSRLSRRHLRSLCSRLTALWRYMNFVLLLLLLLLLSLRALFSSRTETKTKIEKNIAITNEKKTRNNTCVYYKGKINKLMVTCCLLLTSSGVYRDAAPLREFWVNRRCKHCRCRSRDLTCLQLKAHKTIFYAVFLVLFQLQPGSECRNYSNSLRS